LLPSFDELAILATYCWDVRPQHTWLLPDGSLLILAVLE
jgi:hypothetical protein